MNDIDESLSKLFESKPLAEMPREVRQPPALIEQQKEEPEKTPEQQELEADLRFVRSSLYGIMDNGSETIEQLMQLSKESQHPRTYEVLGNFMKNMGEMSDKLLDLHKKKQELTGVKVEAQAQQNITVEKAVFVGTTSDLLKRGEQEKEV